MHPFVVYHSLIGVLEKLVLESSFKIEKTYLINKFI